MKKLILSLLIFCSVLLQAQIQIPQVVGLPSALASKATKPELNLKQTVFTGICQEQFLTENDIVIDNTALTLTIATVKNGQPISALNPICFYTDGNGTAVKHEKSAPVVFNFTNTDGVWYFYFDSSGNPIATQTSWSDFSTMASVYRFYWNSTLAVPERRVIESVEYHKNDISWADHTWKHSEGTKYLSGFDISHNATQSATPNINGSNAVVTLSSGSNIDDNMEYSVTHAASGSVKFTQNLGTGLLPATSGKFICISNDASLRLQKIPATDFPFLWNATTNIPQYLTPTGVRTDVGNGYFFVYYIYALQDPRYGEAIKIKSAETHFASSTLAAAHNWEQLQAIFPTLRDGEIRLLYKLTFEYKSAYNIGTKKAALRTVDDLRKQKTTTTATAGGLLPATSVVVSPIGNIASTNVQSALQELDSEKQPVGTYSTDIHSNITALNDVLGSNHGDETTTSIKTKLGAATSVSDGYLKYQDWVSFRDKISTETDPTIYSWAKGTFPDVVKESGDSYYRAQSGMKVINFGTDNVGGYISDNDSVFIGFRDSKSTFYKPVTIQTQNASTLALSVVGKTSVSDTLFANTLVGDGSKITNLSLDSTNIHTSLKSYDNLLDAKNINYVSIGNSITKGVGSTGDSIGYAYLINKKVGFKSFTNLGIPGARCKPTAGHSELYDEVSIIPTNANLITVMIGINDVTDGGVIGNVAEVIGKTFVTLDRTLSFSEAYRFNMETIKRNFPNAKIYALTPTQTIYNGGIPQKKYVDAIIAISNFLSIPVIDTYNSSGIWKDGNMIPDGIHPNDAGHATIADYVLKKIVEGGGDLIANSVSPFFTDGSLVSLGTPYQFSTLTVSKPSSDDSGNTPTGSFLISAVGDASAGLSMGVSGTSTSTYLQSRSIYNTNKYSLSLNPNGGNVGIGYATDDGYALGKLSVNGTGYFNGAVTAASFSGNGSNLTGIQLPITLTTNGTSGAATFENGVMNVPNYSGTGGSYTASISSGSNTANPVVYSSLYTKNGTVYSSIIKGYIECTGSQGNTCTFNVSTYNGSTANLSIIGVGAQGTNIILGSGSTGSNVVMSFTNPVGSGGIGFTLIIHYTN